MVKLSACTVCPVGKRRDGGTRYWCTTHRANATAKYGLPSERCRYADIPPVADDEMCQIDLADYPGGVGVWGAVAPIYDTTSIELDSGIHIHARRKAEGPKDIDHTFRQARFTLRSGEFELTELDAIYYMVSKVFGMPMKLIWCPRCGIPHLDKDWFSVHPHRSHLCAGCGMKFRDEDSSVGNPAIELQRRSGIRRPPTRASKKSLKIEQSQYQGGIRVWGSNSAILWTSSSSEYSGVHVHAYSNEGDIRPAIDDTFRTVTIDGFRLDAKMARTLMAQNTLPHLRGRIDSLYCNDCGSPHFDDSLAAFAPNTEHACAECGSRFNSKGRLRKKVGNPLVASLERLTQWAPRGNRQHDLGLLPETL